MKKQRKKSMLHHVCVDVEGYLRSFVTKKQQNANLHVYQTLLLARYQNKSVIPIGDECYRFSYDKGCLGHITSLKPTDEKMQEINNEQ